MVTFFTYKMYLISAEGYKYARVQMLIIKKLAKFGYEKKGPVLRQIYNNYKTKNLMKEQIKKYKMTSREIFEKYGDLSEDGLNTKSINNVSEMKKRGKRKKDAFRKKLMISESEILECPEHGVESEIKNIFVNETILKEYSVKIYESDPYFYEHYKEKIQDSKNEHEYILFRINFYFIEYFWAVEIDEKAILTVILFLRKKEKALEKNLVVNLLELMQVKVMMKIMKLVECKHLLVRLKTDN